MRGPQLANNSSECERGENKAALFTEHFKSINRALLYLLLFTAFLGPALLTFVVGSVHLFPYRITWFLMIILSLPYVCLQRQVIWTGLERSKPYFIFLFIWLVYAVLSLLWAVEKGDALRQIVFLAMGISLIFFVTIFLNDFSSLKLLHKLWLLTLILVVVIGFWNMLSGRQLASSSHYGTDIAIPTSLFHYHNDLATYLALSFPFLISYALHSRQLLSRLLPLLLIIPVLALLIATGSRANMLAIAVGALFWFIFMLKGKIRLWVFLSALCLGLLFTAFVLWSPGDMALLIRGSAHGGFEKLFGTFRILSGAEGDLGISFGSRINFIRNGLIYLVDSYGFGVGAGNADYYIASYQYYHTFGYSNPHNWWLEIVVNYGVFIFAGFLYYYFSLMLNLYRLYNDIESPEVKMMAEALLLSLVVFFFASMSTSSLFGYGFPWILFAFATGFVNLGRNNKLEKR